MRVELEGEAVLLHAARALFRPARGQLLVADVHFGKAAAFRARGVPVPHGTTADNLGRLDALIAELRPREIVFLGDLAHARVKGLYERLVSWRERHAAIEMTLVRGNHDARAGDPPPSLGMRLASGRLRDAPFVLSHAPAASANGLVLAGHLHPSYLLRARAREALRLPCFWLSGGCLVLPAFGAFTGTMEVRRQPGDRVFLVAGDRVFET